MATAAVRKKRIGEALSVLRQLGLPREQLNDRSALTLLALLDLTPERAWEGASAPLRGITGMMNFFKEHYGVEYAPNTRETVRRFTMHQFVQAGLAIENPDEPSRPTNSPKWCYQVVEPVLVVVRKFGTAEWEGSLKTLLVELEPLSKRYSCEREANRIPVSLAPGMEIRLSPGGQNVLIRAVLEDFCPTFTPGAQLVYVGDSAAKWAYFDSSAATTLGLAVEAHGKMPDVVLYYAEKEWLVLVEAVTSHGPVTPKRLIELKRLFGSSPAGLVFVSAFADRKTLLKYLGDIAWETEVWCADSPTHLIHFNGERFLGPYA